MGGRRTARSACTRARGRWIQAPLAVLMLLLASACDPVADLLPEAPQPIRLPPAELSGVVFEGFHAGVRDVELRATSAVVDAEARVAELSGVRLRVAGSERGEVSVRASSARLDLRTDDFVLEGGVRGRTAAGERFSTNRVRYEAARSMLVTDDPVRVERRNLVLRGDGMEMDLANERVRVLGRVRTEVGGS